MIELKLTMASGINATDGIGRMNSTSTRVARFSQGVVLSAIPTATAATVASSSPRTHA
ncbi:hypothetical protein [Actinopolymorpha pittospori]|uniref:Uncharacterized protein n=1 Tax=Actinopolymorpha pittospori TaxID=648752 RepID=A0A927N3F0_9ACTN|nr:hypothetical protein [Actinopolymorpha pittospori]MBE1610253.1 hypothetical protein [Actinopolymorpha pittospori]